MASFLKASIFSLKVKRDFWMQLLAEALAFAFIIFLIIAFGKLLEMRAYEISQGQSVDQLKTALLAGSADYNQAFLAHVKGFAVFLTFGILFVFFGGVFVYSYAQAHIWHSLIQKQVLWNIMKKWVGMTFLVMIFCLLFALSYFLIRVIALFFPFNEGSTLVIDRIISFLFVYGFFYVIPFTYYFLAHTGLVWKGVGEFFFYSTRHKKIFIQGYIFALIVGVLIAFVSSVMHILLRAWPAWLLSAITLFLFLLYFAWLRNYVYTVLVRQ